MFWAPGSTPDYFIYENCCSIYNHLQSTNDPLLKVVRFPVNAFHFDCRHKTTDVVCQKHCNPYNFPKLTDANGTWYFNSSK